MNATPLPSGRSSWLIACAVLLTATVGLTGCVSIEPPPVKRSTMEITLPKDWRGLYKVRANEGTSDDVNAAVEAAIIRHYAGIRGGPRVEKVIIANWGVEEVRPDRVVLRGYPNLVSSPHFAVDPLNIYIPGKRVTKFDEMHLTLKFE